MKRNPFYVLSATAMLAGCYLLSHALKLQPGQVGKLVVLIAVLQVYEVLLLILGTYLVATDRAPRDGVMVLALESVFLLDATFLATECVTADVWTGTWVCVALVVLAVAKLAFVRRALPELLPRRTLVILATHAFAVIALPVAAAHLVLASLLSPVLLYGLWWMTLALAPAQKRMDVTTPIGADAGTLHAAWTWLPTAAVLGHLLAIGGIYGIGFQPAFVAPFLLGIALGTRRDQVVRQILLPLLALALSLGQLELSNRFGVGAWMSPLRLALFAAALTYAVLGRRYQYAWLTALASVCGLGAVAGPTLSSLGETLVRVMRLAARLLPKTALEWGAAGVIAAFALLAGGASRSLRGEAGSPSRHVLKGTLRRGGTTASLLFALLAAGLLLSAFTHAPPPDVRSPVPMLSVTAAALLGGALGLWALRRSAHQLADPEGRRVALLSVSISAASVVLASTLFNPHHPSVVVDNVRTVVPVQEIASDSPKELGALDLGWFTSPSETEVPSLGGSGAPSTTGIPTPPM